MMEVVWRRQKKGESLTSTRQYFKHTNKAIMSSQNNMAKESSSLQNHIVWLCSIFVTQNVQIMHNPDDKPSNCFILQYSQTFSTFTQYMSASHGHSTMGGIEYDDGGCVEKTKKRRKSHINQAYRWLWRCPSIDINVSEQGLACNGCTRAISV